MNVNDFYNNSVNVEIFDDPHTFDILNIDMLNLDNNIDGGTFPRNETFSGTDSASTIKKHTNTCKNNRVLGSFKARKYIFPRQDKKHPGYFEGTHTDREKFEYFMNTSCGVLNTNQYDFYCKLAGRDVKQKEISKHL